MIRKPVLFFPACLLLVAASLLLIGQAETAVSGRLLSPPAPDRDGKIRILVYYDMEGISGLTDINATTFGEPAYGKIRPVLTDDVNAAIAAHTYSPGTEWILNDQPVTESDLIAFSWGRAGVPLIMVSGDDKLKEQLSWMGWLQYVVVKTARAPDDATPRPREEMLADMRRSAAQAVQDLVRSRAGTLCEPIKAQLRSFPPAKLDYLDGIPGIDFRNGAVSFLARDFEAMYRGMTGMIGVATRGYNQVRLETLEEMKLSEKVGPQFVRNLLKRWLDVETGKWPLPEAPNAAPEKEKRKYYGY